MDPEVIKARREQIQADSPCDGCGSTLASCKANQGRDKTAPSWFGCCARGAFLDVPCEHVPDSRKLLKLLKEIESGEVASPEQVEDDELLASIVEFRRPRRLLGSQVLAIADANWPDDIPFD
jgi:hypothetical protein